MKSNKSLRYIYCAILLSISASLIQSCREDPQWFSATEIRQEITLEYGNSCTIFNRADEEELILPQECASWEWLSDNPSIADIENFRIIGKRVGETEIHFRRGEGQPIINTKVKVTANASMTIKTGETVSLKEIYQILFNQNDGYSLGQPRISNTEVIKYDPNNYKIIGAHGGTSVAYFEHRTDIACMEFTVIAPFDTDRIQLPYLDVTDANELKEKMGAQKPSFDDIVTIQDKYGHDETYHVVTYKPWGQSESISYYFNPNYNLLHRVYIETGLSNEDSLAYLTAYYTKYDDPWATIFYVPRTSETDRQWYIYQTESWATILFRPTLNLN